MIQGGSVKTLVLAGAAALAMSISTAIVGEEPPVSDPGHHEPPSATGPRMPICLVTKASDAQEGTRWVRRSEVEPTLRSTRSYRGPCAGYGDSVPSGDGRLSAYSQATGDGEPVVVGLSVPSNALEGFWENPPAEAVLDLGADFRSEVDSGLSAVELDWTPLGRRSAGGGGRLDVRFTTDDATVHTAGLTLERDVSVVDEGTDDGCSAVTPPGTGREPGWYPTEYCVRYRPNRDEVTMTLEAFEYRRGT